MNPTQIVVTNDSISKSIENFIRICDNTTSDFGRHRDKLHSLLNELNSIDFKYNQTPNVNQFADAILSVLQKIPLAEDTIIVKTSCLCVQLINKNTAAIPDHVFRQSLAYLIAFIRQHKFVGVCDALRLMQVLIKNQNKIESSVMAEASTQLRQSIELLLELINDPNDMEKTRSCHYDGYSAIEIKSSSIFCLETIIACFDKVPALADCDILRASITSVVFKLIYSIRLDDGTQANYCVLMRAALSACRHIGFSNKLWCTEHIGDILGACISTMMFGLPNYVHEPPQRVQSSQQTVHDSSHSAAAGKRGGKQVKGRKPRQTPQYKNRKGAKSQDGEANARAETIDGGHQFAHSILFETTQEKFKVSTFTTSESDASDTETNRATHNREKEAKLRLSALALMSVVAKNVEKRILFGYWHCLFPTDDLTPSSTALLNCTLRDTNQRCRITALQAASLILYGTKAFLTQAETTEKAPTAFMPFSIALGNRIRIMYATLTQALSAENSLPVLTQILKCLAVLVQSTSFQKIQKPIGFIRDFVKYIRRLVYHKDATIKVAALIVMEFLIAGGEITNEIAECVGLGQLEDEANGRRRIHNFGENEIIDAEENEAESECEEDGDDLDSKQVDHEAAVIQSMPKMSWLLQIALENLGVTVCSYIKPHQAAVSVQVRHQSLQIILSMAPHFVWIKAHLLLLSQALENTIHDDVASVRQRTARCMDIIAHSIGNYLLEQSDASAARMGTEFEDDVELALLFWSKILPSVTEQLQDADQSGATKSIFCDVFSNIGVHVYERMSRDKQILIISLLSGLSLSDEEPLVCASAVRAMAIFALFPSLREDICFIENTMEAAIKIIQDDNLPVRIKASWALANITDALVAHINDPQMERISDHLLLRLFDIVKPTCDDNDKVRTNAARILGNLLRLIKTEHISNGIWQTQCREAIKRLIDQAKLSGNNSNMKVKWNACYAIGNFMKNPVIFYLDVTPEFDWRATVYQSLSDIIVKCANFKVRINGAAALAVPTRRSHYNRFYLDVWNGTLNALYQANCLTDFNEYNHRDNLLDQLCITISHLITLATVEDLLGVENVLMQHLDSTKQNWIRVVNRMVPEKAASLLAANLHLKNMHADETCGIEQKNALHTLLTCFVSVTEYDG